MYEIPQQLEYKEKIVFGLTFGQLMYALIFFPIAFSFFFRLNASLEVRVFLTFIPVSLAAGFMFFDLASQIRNWIAWYRFREIKTKEKIKKLFGIEEIKDDLIYTKWK